MNPALAFAQLLFQKVQIDKFFYYISPEKQEFRRVVSLDDLWVYMVGPIIGGVMAGIFHGLVKNPQNGNMKTKAT
jgi:glycerol uptake facilitator-like aquaporin